MSVFRNLDCLSFVFCSNTTLLKLQTVLFLFFFQILSFEIGGAAYLWMRLIHGRLRYTVLVNFQAIFLIFSGETSSNHDIFYVIVIVIVNFNTDSSIRGYSAVIYNNKIIYLKNYIKGGIERETGLETGLLLNHIAVKY